MDNRVDPLLALLEHAYKVLVRNHRVRRTRDLFPNEYRDDAYLAEQARSILVGFGIARIVRGAYCLPFRYDSRADYLEKRKAVRRTVRLRLKQFLVLFWELTSRGFHEAHVTSSRTQIERLLLTFGLNREEERLPQIYDAFVSALIWLEVVRTRRGRQGGVALEYPDATRRGRAFDPGSAEPVTLRLVQPTRSAGTQAESEENPGQVTGEYQLYWSLKKFFERSRSKNKVDYDREEAWGWRTALVNQGGDPGKPRSQLRDRPNMLLSSRNGEARWRNPDIVGYRIEVAPALGIPDIELLTVEVKATAKEFSRDNIYETISHMHFANVTYFAIGCTYAEIKHKRGLIQQLLQHGIGLVTLRPLQNPADKPRDPNRLRADDWTEAFPARYHGQRQRSVHLLLERYFEEQMTEIRYEYFRAMGAVERTEAG